MNEGESRKRKSTDEKVNPTVANWMVTTPARGFQESRSQVED